eukprot:m.18666 g.18666  ORF g.18666 m.18666 type:complete len:836 (-) comp12145_c0_seq1:250-2757(-)
MSTVTHRRAGGRSAGNFQSASVTRVENGAYMDNVATVFTPDEWQNNEAFKPVDEDGLALKIKLKHITLEGIEQVPQTPKHKRCCPWAGPYLPMRLISVTSLLLVMLFWLPLLPVVIILYIVAGFLSNFMFQEYTKGWGMFTLFGLLSYMVLPINSVLRKRWYEPYLGLFRYLPLWYSNVREGTQTVLETFKYSFFYTLANSVSAGIAQMLFIVDPAGVNEIPPPYKFDLGEPDLLLPLPSERDMLHTIMPCREDLKEDWDHIKQTGSKEDQKSLKDFQKQLAQLFSRKQKADGSYDMEENDKVNLMYCAFISFVHPQFFQSKHLVSPLDYKDVDAMNFLSLYGKNPEQNKALRVPNSALLKSCWHKKQGEGGLEEGDEYEEHFKPLHLFNEEDQQVLGMTQKGTNTAWYGPVRRLRRDDEDSGSENNYIGFLGFLTRKRAVKVVKDLEKELQETAMSEAEEEKVRAMLKAQQHEVLETGTSPFVKNKADFIIPVLQRGDADWAVGSGHSRMNSHPLFRVLGTLFLRLHNQFARSIYQADPEMNVEAIYIAAKIRVMMTVFSFARHVLGKVYIETFQPREYNYYAYKLQEYNPLFWRMMRKGIAEVSFETKITYTFHEFIPDHMVINNIDANPVNFRDIPLVDWCDYCVSTPSGRITNHNTPAWMVQNTTIYVKLCRKFGLQRYTAYRELLGWPKIGSFDEFNCTDENRTLLKQMYADDVDAMDLLVGLYCDRCDIKGEPGVLDFLSPMMHTFVMMGLSFLVIAHPLHDKEYVKTLGLSPEERNFFGQSMSEILRFPLRDIKRTTLERHDCLTLLSKATERSWNTSGNGEVYGSNN